MEGGKMIAYQYKATGGIYYLTDNKKTIAIVFKPDTNGDMRYIQKIDSTEKYDLQYKYKKISVEEINVRFKRWLIRTCFYVEYNFIDFVGALTQIIS
jgi:hypothetical protein